MEPNMDVSAYAVPAMTALMARIEELSKRQYEARQDGGPEDPQIADDLELAKFMAGLVLDYLYAREALDLVFKVD